MNTIYRRIAMSQTPSLFPVHDWQAIRASSDQYWTGLFTLASLLDRPLPGFLYPSSIVEPKQQKHC